MNHRPKIESKKRRHKSMDKIVKKVNFTLFSELLELEGLCLPKRLAATLIKAVFASCDTKTIAGISEYLLAKSKAILDDELTSEDFLHDIDN